MYEHSGSRGGKPYRTPECSENFYKTSVVLHSNYNSKPHISKTQVKGYDQMKILKLSEVAFELGKKSRLQR